MDRHAPLPTLSDLTPPYPPPQAGEGRVGAKSRGVSSPCHQLRQAALPTLRRFNTTAKRRRSSVPSESPDAVGIVAARPLRYVNSAYRAALSVPDGPVPGFP